jgi:hypothetical protein
MHQLQYGWTPSTWKVATWKFNQLLSISNLIDSSVISFVAKLASVRHCWQKNWKRNDTERFLMCSPTTKPFLFVYAIVAAAAVDDAISPQWIFDTVTDCQCQCFLSKIITIFIRVQPIAIGHARSTQRIKSYTGKFMIGNLSRRISLWQNITILRQAVYYFLKPSYRLFIRCHLSQAIKPMVIQI